MGTYLLFYIIPLSCNLYMTTFHSGGKCSRRIKNRYNYFNCYLGQFPYYYLIACFDKTFDLLATALATSYRSNLRRIAATTTAGGNSNKLEQIHWVLAQPLHWGPKGALRKTGHYFQRRNFLNRNLCAVAASQASDFSRKFIWKSIESVWVISIKVF